MFILCISLYCANAEQNISGSNIIETWNLEHLCDKKLFKSTLSQVRILQCDESRLRVAPVFVSYISQ